METSVNREELLEVMQVDADAFASVVIPEVHTQNYPEILVSFWGALVKSAQEIGKVFPKIAIGIPRGHGKSTMVKLYIVYCIIFTRKRFITIICATSGLAENVLADVADMLDSSNIQTLFGNWRTHLTKDTQILKKFSFRGRDIVLAALGSGGSFRGLNIKNARPDLMVFDDSQTKDCAESRVEADAYISWFVSTAMKAKDPAGCTYIYIGNMYKELILKKDTQGRVIARGCHLHNLANDPAWVSYISGALLADGTALWEELHSIETLLAELASDRRVGKDDEWFAEVQNDPTYQSKVIFDPSLITAISEDDLQAMGVPHSAYMVLDPSLGKSKSDAQAVGVFKVIEDTPILAKIETYRKSIQELTRELIAYCVDNNIPAIFTEDYGMQSLVMTWFDFWISEGRIDGIQVIGINRGKLAKTAAITDYLKSLMAGNQILTSSAKSHVVTQAEAFDPQRTDNTDDILDVGYYGNLVWSREELRSVIQIPLVAEWETLTGTGTIHLQPSGRYI